MTMLEVAKKVGEASDDVTEATTRRRMVRLLRRLERKSGKQVLFLENNKLKITPAGLAQLLRHRRDEEQESADEIGQINEELQWLKRAQDVLTASGKRMAREIEQIKKTIGLRSTS